MLTKLSAGKQNQEKHYYKPRKKIELTNKCLRAKHKTREKLEKH